VGKGGKWEGQQGKIMAEKRLPEERRGGGEERKSRKGT